MYYTTLQDLDAFFGCTATTTTFKEEGTVTMATVNTHFTSQLSDDWCNTRPLPTHTAIKNTIRYLLEWNGSFLDFPVRLRRSRFLVPCHYRLTNVVFN